MTAGDQRAQLDADPRVAAWLAKVMADMPPMTPAKIAALRPIAQQMLPHMEAAARRRDDEAGQRQEDEPGEALRAIPGDRCRSPRMTRDGGESLVLRDDSRVF